MSGGTQKWDKGYKEKKNQIYDWYHIYFWTAIFIIVFLSFRTIALSFNFNYNSLHSMSPIVPYK